jgi:hypothetical protein
LSSDLPKAALRTTHNPATRVAAKDRYHGILRNEDGAAIVEAALILPLILLIVFGLMEVSFYAWNFNLANKAVQLGTRRAIVSDAVAFGPGLVRAESATYWAELTPGLRCLSAGTGPGPCPRFAVTCGAGMGCTCRGTACAFTFARPKLSPILQAMRTVLPQIGPENLELTYATNGLGYVGRPPPVPVDVTIRLVGLEYESLFLGALLGARLPLRASATLPGEDLSSR